MQDCTLPRVSRQLSRVHLQGHVHLHGMKLISPLFFSHTLHTMWTLLLRVSRFRPSSVANCIWSAQEPCDQLPLGFLFLCLTTSISLHFLILTHSCGVKQMEMLTSSQRSFGQVFCIESQVATSLILRLPWPELHKFHDCLYCHQTHYTSHYSAGQPCHRQH